MVVNRQKLFERIFQVLEEMPEPMKQVFILARYRGLDPEQIVGRVGMEVEEIASLLRRAQRFLYRGVQPLIAGSERRNDLEQTLCIQFY